MEKLYIKCAPKASPRALFNLGKLPKTVITYKKFFLKKHFEKVLSKSLKKINFISLWNPVSFNGQSYQKQKGPRPNDQFLFRLQNKFRKIPLLAIYYLTKFDDVI